MKKYRTYEDLSLLINYISVIGIWFAIPTLNLLIIHDKRWIITIIILFVIVSLLIIAYLLQWEVLFPKTAAEQNRQ